MNTPVVNEHASRTVPIRGEQQDQSSGLSLLSDAVVERQSLPLTPAQFAELVGRTVTTVRDWCRLGRINARKTICGRGGGEWRIELEEFHRLRRDGLLPTNQTTS